MLQSRVPMWKSESFHPPKTSRSKGQQVETNSDETKSGTTKVHRTDLQETGTVQPVMPTSRKTNKTSVALSATHLCVCKCTQKRNFIRGMELHRSLKANFSLNGENYIWKKGASN